MSVIELSARYHLVDGLAASLTIECDLEQLNANTVLDEQSDEDSDSQVILTLIHERFTDEIASYDFLDTFTLPLSMYMGESLTVIARYEGRIIGSLVNEVDTSGMSRLLLHPKGGFNVIVYQERTLQAPLPAESAAPDLAGIPS